MSLNKLVVNIKGQGESLLVLHGWGMDHTIWLPIKQMLEENYTVTWLDLPGYGENKAYEVSSLEEMVSVIRSVCCVKTHVLGWSLGGLIAQRLAYLYPTVVKSLILVATSPAFVQTKMWQYAMPKNVLNTFVSNLEIDYRLTLKRFLSLQFVGVKDMRGTLKLLREVIITMPLPTIDTLRVGLSILKETDLRYEQGEHKKLWVLGKIDKLVPYQVSSDLLAMKMENKSQTIVIDGAGHAPFISHPALFTHHVTEFLRDV